MGTTVIRTLDSTQVQQLLAQRQALQQVGGSQAAAGKFNFFAAFDGTNNDRNNLSLSGSPYQTNVANLFDQATAAATPGGNLVFGYYRGVGTGGENGGLINAAISPTAAVHAAAEEAYSQFAREARNYLSTHPGATPESLTTSITGFSRGTASAIVFAQLLNARGLKAADGTVLAPPGSIKVTGGLALMDPVFRFIDGDLSIPGNVEGPVLVAQALDETRSDFRLADFSNDSRVRTVWVSGNHSGIGGGYDIDGTAAVVLEGLTAYFHQQGTGLADVPASRRFDPNGTVEIYSEAYQTGRNGDVLVDENGNPKLVWRVDDGPRRTTPTTLPPDTHDPTDPHSSDAVNGLDFDSDRASRAKGLLTGYLTDLGAVRAGESTQRPALADLMEAEQLVTVLYEWGQVGGEFYRHFSEWATGQMLSGGSVMDAQPTGSGLNIDPIGAFYESRSAATDPAHSIAGRTPTVLAGTAAVDAAGLAARDADGDGRLSGSELDGLQVWSDLDEDGLLDSGELKSAAQAGLAQIRSRDYAFYTAGNAYVSQPRPDEAQAPAVAALAAVSAPGAARPSRPTISGTGIAPVSVSHSGYVPFSNYRSLRDFDNVFYVSDGQINWTPNQVKISYLDQTYLIGTDGNDAFDARYWAAYPQYFDVSKLVNFLGGNGNDTVGGSARADNIWGGTGHDALLGYAGDDKLYGEEGDDELQGQDGADVLEGGLGTDRLFGGAGDDVLNGADGNDLLFGFTPSNDAKQALAAGETDNDKLYGGAGDDYADGSLGDDYVDGGDGNDSLLGGAGQDVLIGGLGLDELQGGDGADRLAGGAGNDRLFGQTGDDMLWGGDGDDVMLGFTGTDETKQTLNAGETDDDVLRGEGGNDTLYGGLGNDRLDGGAGNDFLNGDAGDDTVLGSVGNDELHGQAGNDGLDGGDGDDLLFGEAGQDAVFGGTGVDELQGGDGNDQLLGEDGNDRLFGQTGDDVLWGGDGDDMLMGFTATNEAKQSLAVGETDDDMLHGEGGNDQMFGGLGDDWLDGGEGADFLNGGAGSDTVLGAAGDDELHGQDGADRLIGGAGTDLLFGDAGDDTLSGGDDRDELQAGDGNDRLLGEAGDDKLFGQAGDDTLQGGDGDDVLVGFTASNEAKQVLAAGESDNDTIFGEGGNDNLYGGLGNDVLDGGSGQDLVCGNEGDDHLWGGDGQDELLGGAGNDQLMGGAGGDRLFGQVGNDILHGGDGNDIMVGFTASNEAQQTLDAGESDDDRMFGGAGNDLMLGALGDDELHGDAGNDELQGGAGRDRMNGGAGADRLFGQVGDDLMYGGDGDDILVGFTAFNETKQTLDAGESDNDHLYGGAGRDLLLGGLGDDYLDGGAGADDMEGGAGDDVYIVNSVNDRILEMSWGGHDRVISSVNYLLDRGVEELRLLEGLDINGTGNALDNTIIGNERANILDGVTGADRMIGGAGDDVYYIDNTGDQAVELAGEGSDTVQSSISHTLADNLENLVLLDFSKPEKGLADGTPIMVYGYPKLNELDYMQGDAVPDFLGTCALTSIANLLTQADRPTTEAEVVQVAIDNNWAVTDPNRPAYERGGSNYIDQQNILNSYGIRNDLLVGFDEQAVANLIRSGRGVIVAVNAGKLWGEPAYEGDGSVNHAVTLTGAAYRESDGALMGFYLADSGRQKVSDMTRFVSVEEFRAAAQVPYAYSIYTLEPLKLWNEDINGAGNALNNTLVGNRGDNMLEGEAGDDMLDGAGGNDTLRGGGGADTLQGGAGNDWLDGGAGDDRLDGGTGNDTYLLARGSGRDVIDDVDALPGNTDVLQLGAGIGADQLWFRRTGEGDLEVSVIGTNDAITIHDWYLAGSGQERATHIEQFRTADGGVLLDTQVAQLVQAMAAFAPPPMGQTSLAANYQASLAPVLAVAWSA